MIPKECKRLAEVDFPIAEVSRHAAREKSIRHGHPSTLHLWWARRPLASSRAVLMALLLPDPCDPHCPDEFKARGQGNCSWRCVGEGASGVGLTRSRPTKGSGRVLLRFIADFRQLGQLAPSRSTWKPDEGWSKLPIQNRLPWWWTPSLAAAPSRLEALRLGCETFASDLNPVACLILKVMLEDIPRHGLGLADELRKAGAEIKAQAEKELADLYPKDPDGATPIAYLWARTVRCESPNCGAEIPLMRSMWLCRKPKRKWALRPNVVRDDGVPPRVEFGIFEPKADREVADGTVTRAKATCLCCRTVLPPERVRAQLAAQRGGADTVFDEDGNRTGGAMMTAAVTLKEGQQGRHYRLPTDADYAAVRLAQERVEDLLDEWAGEGRQGLCPVPDEPTPAGGGSGAGRAFSVQRYGMLQWGDLFTARQKAALVRLLNTVRGTTTAGLVSVLACAFNRVSMSNMTCTRWNAIAEKMQHTFGRQALPMVWDFAEIVVTADAPGNWKSGYSLISDVVDMSVTRHAGQVQEADATDHPLPSQSASVWFTDPPYYDAIPYADLSDFFLVWLKRSLPDHALMRDPFDPDNPLSPKIREAVQDETKLSNEQPKNRQWFEATMAEAFAEGRRVLNEDGVGSVVFAHKTTEGWEALLSGMIRGGWTITGSWPIATEMGSRLRARDSAALATSIHLICRPRPEDAPIGEWADVLRELPVRVGDWMQRLEAEGVRGADLVFACIGPALEIYSRYRRVETPDGHEVILPEYLERVWEVVGREALKQVLGTAEAQARNGAAGALEEDARLTALFLWTMQSTAETADNGVASETDEDGETPQGRVSGFSLPFDVARRFAQPLGIHLEDWESRIIQTEKGVVRLRPVTDRAKELLGEAGADALADEIETNAAASAQMSLFPEQAPTVRGRSHGRGNTAPATGDGLEAQRGATTLDRVHAAMLLQASGRTEALRKPFAVRTGPRPRLPPAGQRPLGSLPPGQRGETPAGRDAAGSTKITKHPPGGKPCPTTGNF